MCAEILKRRSGGFTPAYLSGTGQECRRGEVYPGSFSSVVLHDGPKNGMYMKNIRGTTLAIPHLFEIQQVINIKSTDCAIIPLSGDNIGVVAGSVKKNENNETFRHGRQRPGLGEIRPTSRIRASRRARTGARVPQKRAPAIRRARPSPPGCGTTSRPPRSLSRPGRLPSSP